MTTLVIALQEKTMRIPLAEKRAELSARYAGLNDRGFLTFFVLSVMLAAAAAYAGTLYWMTGAGFALQERQESRREGEQEILRLEMALRAEEAALFEENHPLLQAMEKVSHINFIGIERENVAQASESSLRP